MSQNLDTNIDANLDNDVNSEDQNVEAAGSSSDAALKLNAFYGVKAGMTSVYTEQGVRVPVTVLECNPWTVTQIKTKEKDGYEAVQISGLPRKLKSSRKSEIGHNKKAGIDTAMRYSREVRQSLPEGVALGQKVDLTSFEKGDILKVSALSKGKGFSGVVKRFNFGGGPATHGSGFHRRPGSIGNREFPGRVMPGKKMAGQMGNKITTTKGLEIIDILLDQNVLLVKGSIPGSVNTLVEITKI
jgi:large subunit ribosomal protein L3